MLRPETLRRIQLPKAGGGRRTVWSFTDAGDRDRNRSLLKRRFLKSDAEGVREILALTQSSAAVICFDIADCYNSLVYTLDGGPRSRALLIGLRGQLGTPHELPDMEARREAKRRFLRERLGPFLMPREEGGDRFTAPAGIPSSPRMASIALEGVLALFKTRLPILCRQTARGDGPAFSLEPHLYADNLFFFVARGRSHAWQGLRALAARLERELDLALARQLGLSLRREKSRLVIFAPLKRCPQRHLLGMRLDEMGRPNTPRPVQDRLRREVHALGARFLDIAAAEEPDAADRRLPVRERLLSLAQRPAAKLPQMGPDFTKECARLAARALHYLSAREALTLSVQPTLLGLLADLYLMDRLTRPVRPSPDPYSFPWKKLLGRLQMDAPPEEPVNEEGVPRGDEPPPIPTEESEEAEPNLPLSVLTEKRRRVRQVFQVALRRPRRDGQPREPLPAIVFPPVPAARSPHPDSPIDNSCPAPCPPGLPRFFPQALEGVPPARRDAILGLLAAPKGAWPKGTLARKALVTAALLKTGPGMGHETLSTLASAIARFVRTRGFSTSRPRSFLVPFLLDHVGRCEAPCLSFFHAPVDLEESSEMKRLRRRLLGPLAPGAFLEHVDALALGGKRLERYAIILNRLLEWDRAFHDPQGPTRRAPRGALSPARRFLIPLEAEAPVDPLWLRHLGLDLIRGRLDSALDGIEERLGDPRQLLHFRLCHAFTRGATRAQHRVLPDLLSGRISPENDFPLVREVLDLVNELVRHQDGARSHDPQRFKIVRRFLDLLARRGHRFDLLSVRHPALLAAEGESTSFGGTNGLTHADAVTPALRSLIADWLGPERTYRAMLERLLAQLAEQIGPVRPPSPRGPKSAAAGTPRKSWLDEVRSLALENATSPDRGLQATLLLLRRLRHLPACQRKPGLFTAAAHLFVFWRIVFETCDGEAAPREDSTQDTEHMAQTAAAVMGDVEAHLGLVVRDHSPALARRFEEYRPFLGQVMRASRLSTVAFRPKNGSAQRGFRLTFSARLPAVLERNRVSEDCSFDRSPHWAGCGCFGVLSIHDPRGEAVGAAYVLASPFAPRYEEEVPRGTNGRPWSFAILDKVQLKNFRPEPGFFDALFAHPIWSRFDLGLAPRHHISNYSEVDFAWRRWISARRESRQLAIWQTGPTGRTFDSWARAASQFENGPHALDLFGMGRETPSAGRWVVFREPLDSQGARLPIQAFADGEVFARSANLVLSSRFPGLKDGHLGP